MDVDWNSQGTQRGFLSKSLSTIRKSNQILWISVDFERNSKGMNRVFARISKDMGGICIAAL